MSVQITKHEHSQQHPAPEGIHKRHLEELCVCETIGIYFTTVYKVLPVVFSEDVQTAQDIWDTFASSP